MSARASGASVRAATKADAAPLTAMLARAFHDDPLTMHLLPDEAARSKGLPRMFGLLFKFALPHGGCYVSSNCETATLWRPPGHWHVPMWQILLNAPEFLRIFGIRALSVTSTLDALEKVHPKANHWYLQTIGTDPAMQGKGYGGLIMRDQLARADAARIPCYLESSKDTNVPIYKSFGFNVTGEIKLANGPTLWPMWRDVPAA